MQHLVSISILDTCIGMRHTNWHAAIEHFCRMFAEDSGCPDLGQVIFRQRLLGERRAVIKHGAAPSLEQIYAEMRVLPSWMTDATALLLAESRFHFDQAVCHRSAHSLISKLRESGAGLVFTASTPMPRAAVHRLLERFGLIEEGDAICLSHEIGAVFPSRRAFHRLLKNLHIKPAQWVHYGNGDPAERTAVRRLRGTYKMLPATLPNRYEAADAITENGRPYQASVVMALQRNTRLTAGRPEHPAVNVIFANVVAPLITAFVQQVLADAHRRGLHTLHFVAPEGQILKMIAEQLPHPGIELRYLYGGHRAWMLPALTDHPEQAVEWMMPAGSDFSPREILRRAEISPEEVRPWLYQFKLSEKVDTPLRGSDLQAMRRFLQHLPLVTLIAEKAAERRGPMLAYLDQEGLTNSRGWALVRLGWSGQLQQAMSTVLRSSGWSGEVEGYYLGLSEAHVDFAEAGPAHGFLIDDQRFPRQHPVRTLFRCRGLISELFTMADHGETVAYAARGAKVVPRFHPVSLEPQKADALLAQHTICKQFARLWSQSHTLGVAPETLKRCALRNLALFFNQPAVEEVQVVRQLMGRRPASAGEQPPMAKPYSLLDLLPIGRSHAFRRSRPRWREGSIAITSSSVRTCMVAASKFQSLWHGCRRANNGWT